MFVFHLTVNKDGAVSIWDRAGQAQSIEGEVYVEMLLTPAQQGKVIAAQQQAERMAKNREEGRNRA